MPESLDRFRRIVAQDSSLQEMLGGPWDRRAFSMEMVRLGGARGCPFTAADVEMALHGRPGPVPWPPDSCPPAGWVPSGLTWAGAAAHVAWVYVGRHRFTEPFFHETLQICRRCPLGRLLECETSSDVLSGMAARPDLPPTGFVFHMSRCGSTLIAQLLAALPQNIVLSEPEPLDAILSARLSAPTLTEKQQILWLRGAVSALGRRRHASERHLFVKFDCWHVAALPLIRRAFPNVPCLFVYRDPVEVLVSHGRQPGRQMVPGLVEPRRLDLEAPVSSTAGLEEYRVRVLGRICEYAVRQFGDGSGSLMEYRQLPEAIWTQLPALFGLTLSPEDLDRMHRAARFDAKSPSEEFAADGADKRKSATPSQRRLVAKHVQPHYERLEALRGGPAAFPKSGEQHDP